MTLGTRPPREFRSVATQLREYFAGQRTRFEIAVEPDGTPFQRNVWRALQDIPYGETISYGTLARRLGDVKATRAVGLANGANPIAIVIPCHRVIGNGGLALAGALVHVRPTVGSRGVGGAVSCASTATDGARSTASKLPFWM